MLLGESRLATALAQAAKRSPADETLLAAQRGSFTTLRFAGGKIHQNFHEEDITVWVKVAAAGRMGVATTCSIGRESLERAVAGAMTIVKMTAPATKIGGSVRHRTLADGKQVAPAFSVTPPKEPTLELTTHFPQTLHEPFSEIVGKIRGLWRCSEKLGMGLAGSFVRGEEELAVVGSGGLVQYQPFSVAGLRLVATEGKASGFAAQVSRDLKTLDFDALAKRAWDFCRKNKNPQPIPIGKYDVLLEPEAVAELLEWLGAIGFGAKQMVERTSFMAGRIGQRIMHRSISIIDDGTDSQGLAAPFDYEGVPKRRVPLIQGGVAQNVVYDSHYAKLHHRSSTGHALSFNEFEGPLAGNLFMEKGTTPYKELLPMMDRGLWICRFHYVSGLLKTQEALMTGLTRDGTFLIKNGKVAEAVKNLRFTQSILEAFSRVAAVSRERRLIADPSQGLSAAVCPALLIKNFTFTGQTQ